MTIKRHNNHYRFYISIPILLKNKYNVSEIKAQRHPSTSLKIYSLLSLISGGKVAFACKITDSPEKPRAKPKSAILNGASKAIFAILALAFPTSKNEDIRADIMRFFIKHSEREIAAEKNIINEQTEREIIPADLTDEEKSKLCLVISFRL